MEALTVWGPEEGCADEETEAGDGVHPGFATRHVFAHRQTEGSHGPGAGPGVKTEPRPSPLRPALGPTAGCCPEGALGSQVPKCPKGFRWPRVSAAWARGHLVAGNFKTGLRKSLRFLWWLPSAPWGESQQGWPRFLALAVTGVLSELILLPRQSPRVAPRGSLLGSARGRDLTLALMPPLPTPTNASANHVWTMLCAQEGRPHCQGHRSG